MGLKLTGLLGLGLGGLLKLTEPVPDPKKHVVVIGYGWGGKGFCDSVDYNKYNVTVVSKTNGMLDTTKLKHVFQPIKLSLTGSLRSDFINDECVKIDPQKKQVAMSKGLILPYDYLVLAVGSVPNDFGIPGVVKYCHFLKTVEDHIKLQNALRLTKGPVVIMGAGPTGIELAFELSKEGYKVTLIDAMPNILPMFSDKLVQIVKKELEKYGIDLMHTKIEHIDDKTINGKIPYAVAIWTCGVKSNPLIKQITESSLVPVNDKLQVINHPDIYAIGDIVGHGPPTAQKAEQQGRFLAERNLGSPSTPHNPSH